MKQFVKKKLKLVRKNSIVKHLDIVQNLINLVNDLHYKNGRKYRGWPAYGQSKLANLIFAKELAKRLKEQKHDHVTAVSVSPGIIRTNLWRYTNFFL
jgi:NAD(P)-dependent dehydrogenase (short-subunit alcohol dehydrogenase family)